MPDFIETYPDALPPEACDHLIQRFEQSPDVRRGEVGAGVNTQLKDSYDLTISELPDWENECNQVSRVTSHFTCVYLRKYYFALIGALSLSLPDPQTNQPVPVTQDNIDQVPDEPFARMVGGVFRFGTLNLQKYLRNQGGYPHWHSEIYPLDETGETLHRVLLFTYYLNDVPEAGETEFVYQNRKIAPKRGTLIIAPAGFTHTHRGNTPVGGDKYILTSWILYKRAEHLFGRQ